MKRNAKKKMLLLSLLAAAVGIGGCAGGKTVETADIAGNEIVHTAESTLQTEEKRSQEMRQTAEEKTVEKQTEEKTENSTEKESAGEEAEARETEAKETEARETATRETSAKETEEQLSENETSGKQSVQSGETAGKSEAISWNSDWKYAENSEIHTGSAVLYYMASSQPRGKTICINAGHGTSGGSEVYTLCHPDGSPKVTGGSTAKGQTKATAVSEGTTMKDGTPEAAVTLELALIIKERLLEEGYNVLMIREDSDVQLDNIARTVMANQYADCHIALHYDSTESDKGVFYIGVPEVDAYRSMEPVASHWQDHERLGKALIAGMKQQGVKIFGDGSMDIDLTQTSYSTIPSVDLEVGDRASDDSGETLEKLADGIAAGLEEF